MNIEEIKLYGDRVLIDPLEPFTYTVKENRPKVQIPTGKDINLDEVPEVTSDDMEEVDVEVTSDVQLAKVIAVGDANHIVVKVGDTIMYHRKSGILFELLGKAVLLKNYDVIGVVNN